jgi:hypothetical protein
MLVVSLVEMAALQALFSLWANPPFCCPKSNTKQARYEFVFYCFELFVAPKCCPRADNIMVGSFYKVARCNLFYRLGN